MLPVLSLVVGASAAHAAAAIFVTTTVPGVNADAECSLQEAIYAANLDASKAPDPANLGDPDAFITTGCIAGSDDDVIWLPAGATFTMSGPDADVSNYVGPTATPMVKSSITIEALGAKVQHGGGSAAYRAFAVGVGGNLTLHEIHVKGFEVHGGEGSYGGGGGMGAGGAVYVQGGRLGVGWSTFEGNGALGGDGSDGAFSEGGGGGGGIGGDGGGNDGQGGGGGGGGARGDGAPGQDGSCGIICPGGSEGGGGGGTYADGQGDAGGYRCGADGSATIVGLFIPDARDGENADCFGGGGGGGQEAATLGVIGGFYGGDGGRGNYGGGGGGGAYLLFSGDGGHGGFGGGGGGANTTEGNITGFGPDGGDAGFAGGGGAAAGGAITGSPGAGGTFGGDASGDAGGGGGGLGGAIFGDEAVIDVRNSTFVGNYANRGHSGGTGANDGRGAGGAIFLVDGSVFVNSSTFSNNQTGEFTTGVGGIGGGGIVVYKSTRSGSSSSLTLRNSILAGNGPHECYGRNGASLSGLGNLITDNSANISANAPCPGVTTSVDPALGALALNLPGRTPTLAIAAGSSAIDAASPATSEPDDQRGVLRPAATPDIGAYEAGAAAPTTTIALSPTSPNGSNGWYTSAVGVTISAVDDGTVAQTRCVLDPASAPAAFTDLPDAACALTTVGTDGQHAIYAASKDDVDNIETPLVTSSLKVDRTAPILAPTLSSNPVVIGQTGVTASPNATDPTSGVASQSCGAVDTSTPGAKTVACTATDNAGNVRNIDAPYVVEYRILGFFEPVPGSKWRVGQTVPVKIALGDGADARVSDADGIALAAACRVKFSASGAQSKTAQCMKYDPDKDQFVYAWRLGKSGTGAATIRAFVTYPGTTSTTQKTLQITITS